MFKQAKIPAFTLSSLQSGHVRLALSPVRPSTPRTNRFLQFQHQTTNSCSCFLSSLLKCEPKYINLRYFQFTLWCYCSICLFTVHRIIDSVFYTIWFWSTLTGPTKGQTVILNFYIYQCVALGRTCSISRRIKKHVSLFAYGNVFSTWSIQYHLHNNDFTIHHNYRQYLHNDSCHSGWILFSVL